MKNSKWMKGFGIGIIILFIGMSVLPSTIAKVANIDAPVDRPINISTTTATLIFIGSIKNSNDSGNHVSFECIRVLGISFVDGKLQEISVIEGGYPFWCYYDSKIGFIGKHFICAIFKLTG
jgi:hypothetical protein